MMLILFSTKADGDMLFKSGSDANHEIRSNRIRFFEKNGIDPARVVNLNGIHGTHIETIYEKDLGRGALDPDTRIPGTDGLITAVPNSYLLITGADCFPILFWNGSNNVIGALHAGWRGIIGSADLRRSTRGFTPIEDGSTGIILQMVNAFRGQFNIQPTDIHTWVGPGIQDCHFEVQNDVAELFKKQYDAYVENRGGKIFIDLPGIIKDQLIQAGITDIEENSDCTYCKTDAYFSYRRDRPQTVEANAFLICQK